MQRRSGRMATFALLRFARNARLSFFVQGQSTGQSERWPTFEPVVHILIRQAPQGTQQADEQQALLAIRSWRTSWTGGQGRRATTMSDANGKMTEGEQMQ